MQPLNTLIKERTILILLAIFITATAIFYFTPHNTTNDWLAEKHERESVLLVD